MVWLYKGSYSCAYELGTGEATLSFLHFPIKMLQVLVKNGITPVCVFDGQHLLAKKKTEGRRIEMKQRNRELAEEAEARGDEMNARKYFSRSLVLKEKMVHLFMDVLHELSIEFLVAPYEADAQMTYMVKSGVADFAISEDSDLVAYGCPRILMKLETTGEAMLWSHEHFKAFSAQDKSMNCLRWL